MAETAAGAAEWNVVVTIREARFREARKFLRRWGEVRRTDHFHVVAMRADDPEGLLAEIGEAAAATPGIYKLLSHVMPAQRTFVFASAEEFEAKARDIALPWAPMLAGRSFHVRLHRRGFKGILSTPKEERFLDDALLDALEAGGRTGAYRLYRSGCDPPDRNDRRPRRDLAVAPRRPAALPIPWSRVTPTRLATIDL